MGFAGRLETDALHDVTASHAAPRLAFTRGNNFLVIDVFGIYTSHYRIEDRPLVVAVSSLSVPVLFRKKSKHYSPSFSFNQTHHCFFLGRKTVVELHSSGLASKWL